MTKPNSFFFFFEEGKLDYSFVRRGAISLCLDCLETLLGRSAWPANNATEVQSHFDDIYVHVCVFNEEYFDTETRVMCKHTDTRTL